MNSEQLDLLARLAYQDLKAYKKILDASLDTRLQEFKKDLKPPFTNKNIRAVIQALSDLSLKGGKRIRGTLARYAYKAIQNNESSCVLDLAMAIELIHSYLLMEDDIMDRDDFRHGYPTAHKILEKYFKKTYPESNLHHMSISFTMLAFTLAQHLAFELIAKMKASEKKRLEITKYLHKMVEYTIYGQILDLETELEKRVTEEQVIQVHTSKTAHYTFRNPVIGGALLADASKKQIEILEKYALPVGIAFQLRDDIIGLFGNEEAIGKPVGSDLREGKKTMLIVKAYEFGHRKQITFLRKQLGNRTITKEEVEECKKIVQDTGSLDYSQNLIEKYTNRGIEELLKKENLFNKEGLDFLLGAAHYIGIREY